MSVSGVLPQIESVNRVLSLPVVQAGFSLASVGYGRVKNLNRLTEAACHRAEAAITFTVEISKPIVDNVASRVKPVEPFVARVDNIMCTGLDMLESHVPAVKKSPSEILNDGRRKYELIRQMSSDRIHEARGYGAARVASVRTQCLQRVGSVVNTQYVQAIIHSVDTAMDLTEQAVDRFLPAAEGEPQQSNHSSGPNAGAGEEHRRLMERMGYLSDKMRHRMTYQVTIQLNNLQKRGHDVYGLSVKEAHRVVEQLTTVVQHILANAQQIPRPLAVLLPSRSRSQSVVSNGSGTPSSAASDSDISQASS